MINKKRKSFTDCAIQTAKLWAERSEDIHKKVGCCILDKNGRILSVGYNGLKAKMNKNKNFWLNRDERRPYIFHAEINALSLITKKDQPTIIATTLLPCKYCALNIAAYDIKNVIYIEDYERDQMAKRIFRFYNINLIQYK